MNTDDESPLAGLNLSERDHHRAWVLIRAQIEVVEKMKRFTLGIAIVLLSQYVLHDIVGPSSPPNAPFEPVIKAVTDWIGWATAAIGVVGLTLYQLWLLNLRRFATTLQIPREKLKYINNLTNWALIRTFFGQYGYKLITGALVKLGITR